MIFFLYKTFSNLAHAWAWIVHALDFPIDGWIVVGKGQPFSLGKERQLNEKVRRLDGAFAAC